MPRAKRGFKARQRRKKVMKQASGYRGGRSTLFRTAQEAVDKGLQYAFKDRRLKKRDFRSLWIQRLSAAAKLAGLSYSKLISGLKKAKVLLDRKVLSDIAISDPIGFGKLIEIVKGS
ncbi:MAG: 50S ribosomal protein L20 [bacterium]